MTKGVLLGVKIDYKKKKGNKITYCCLLVNVEG